MLRLLTRKFGVLPELVQTRVLDLPTDTLLNLSDILLDFNELEDVTRWLDEHP